MENNIDKDEIRRAIDRLQIEHPCDIAYDPIAFANMEAVNTIKRCVDQIAKRMAEDTEINIICEFAKLYLEGVRPMVMPKQDWIPCTDSVPEEGTRILFCDIDGDVYCGEKYYGGTWWDDRNDDHVKNVIAWMPLPEPYKEEGEENG